MATWPRFSPPLGHQVLLLGEVFVGASGYLRVLEVSSKSALFGGIAGIARLRGMNF